MENGLSLALPEFPGGSLDRTFRGWSEIRLRAGVGKTPRFAC